MISAQQELMRVLLDAVYARGLLSKTTYLSAVDLVHSALDIPPFFRYPVCLTEEASGHECTQDTQ